MFALTAVYAVTRESFYSTLVLSFVTSWAAVAIVLRAPSIRGVGYRALLFMAVLLGSKAFLDYSSSGLENPLTHVLLALFFTRMLSGSGEAETQPRLVSAFLLAALGFVNRMDTLLLFAPSCALLLYERRSKWRATLTSAGLGSLPALAWVVFALFYYGSAVPNTALAKLAGPRVTMLERMRAGIAYMADSAMFDPLTLTLCSLAIAVALVARRPRSIAAASGIALYLLYILTTGAIGTHMSGRFFSGPLFLSAMVLAYEASHVAVAVAIGMLTALWLASSTVSPLRVGFDGYGQPDAGRGKHAKDIIDTRRYVASEGAALLNVIVGEPMPRHAWYLAGERSSREPDRVHIGGPSRAPAIGYFGFAAGPTKEIIDEYGLSDPLLARIPLALRREFRPGHFKREVPEGYVESMQNDANLITDPSLKRYYEKVRLVTRGPLWSAERIRTLIR
jgi:arabinofuranosyltransferase